MATLLPVESCYAENGVRVRCHHCLLRRLLHDWVERADELYDRGLPGSRLHLSLPQHMRQIVLQLPHTFGSCRIKGCQDHRWTCVYRLPLTVARGVFRIV